MSEKVFKNYDGVRINVIANILGLHKYIAWKLFINDKLWAYGAWCTFEFNFMPFLGRSITIFRNRTNDMNNWTVSQKDAELCILRFKQLPPEVLVKVLEFNKKFMVSHKQGAKTYSRSCLMPYCGTRLNFHGELVAIRKNKSTNHLEFVFQNVTSPDSKSIQIDHACIIVPVDVYIVHRKMLSQEFPLAMSFSGYVEKYNYEDRFGIKYLEDLKIVN